jgi:hypothetical protein
MSRVTKLMHDLWQLEAAIEKQTDILNRMRSKYALLTTVDIPEAMTEIGSKSFDADDGSGLYCSVDYRISGSLPGRDNQDARMAAIEYLKEHDGAELIQAKVQVSYGRGDISAANKMRRKLITLTNQPVTVDADVHHSSLAAWGRARVKENLPIDLGIVGLRGFTTAVVKKRK